MNPYIIYITKKKDVATEETNESLIVASKHGQHQMVMFVKMRSITNDHGQKPTDIIHSHLKKQNARIFAKLYTVRKYSKDKDKNVIKKVYNVLQRLLLYMRPNEKSSGTQANECTCLASRNKWIPAHRKQIGSRRQTDGRHQLSRSHPVE